MATSLVFPVLRQVQGVIEVADKCREDLKDISKYIHTLSAVLVRILGGFEPGSTWEQSFLDLLEDIFRTVFAALRLADRCILYDGFGFFAKAAAFGLEREVSRVKEQLRVDLESLNSFLLADIWVATKQQQAAGGGGRPRGASPPRAPAPPACPAFIAQRQASQAHRLLLSMPKLQTSRHPAKQVAQALAWLRVGKAKAQSKAMAALCRMLASPHWAAKAADILAAGGVHAVLHHLGSPDAPLRDAAVRTLARLAQAEAASAPPECPSEVLAGVVATLDSFTYAQASGFVVVERTASPRHHQPPADELFLAAVAAAATLQLFAITPAHCAAAVHNGALPAVVDALAAAAATGGAGPPDDEDDEDGVGVGLRRDAGASVTPSSGGAQQPHAAPSSSSSSSSGGGGSRRSGSGGGAAAEEEDPCSSSDARQQGDQAGGGAEGEGQGGSAGLLHASLVQQLTRTCHLLMLHDEAAKRQLLDLGLLPLLVSILCTLPAAPPAAAAAGGSEEAAADPTVHPQLEAARALVCLAALPEARAALEARPEAMAGLQRLARRYQGCFAGEEVAQWLGLEGAAASAPALGGGAALEGPAAAAGELGLGPGSSCGSGGEQQGGAGWLGVPRRAVLSATAAASSAVLQVWRGSPRGEGQQLSFPIDAQDEWGAGSGDVDHILLGMQPSDMQ